MANVQLVIPRSELAKQPLALRGAHMGPGRNCRSPAVSRLDIQQAQPLFYTRNLA
jgi:hypothetical protein